MSESDQTRHLMNFLLEQQAQLTASVSQLSETVKELAEAQRRTENRWERAEESIRALLTIAEMHEREMTDIRATIKEAQDRTDKQMAETDERLNAFINFVERYLSGRRGGENGGDDPQA